MTDPFLPPGSFVDPSHVLAIWVEPETLERIGVGALPLDICRDPERDYRPPPWFETDGPIPGSRFEWEPEPMKYASKVDGFPTGSVDIQAGYLFRVLAFMEEECDVIRVETKGRQADAPLLLTGFRDNGGPIFDDTKPIIIAALAPRELPRDLSQSAPSEAVTSPPSRVHVSNTPTVTERTQGESEGQASTDESGRASQEGADTCPVTADRTSTGEEVRGEDL